LYKEQFEKVEDFLRNFEESFVKNNFAIVVTKAENLSYEEKITLENEIKEIQQLKKFFKKNNFNIFFAGCVVEDRSKKIFSFQYSNVEEMCDIIYEFIFSVKRKVLSMKSSFFGQEDSKNKQSNGFFLFSVIEKLKNKSLWNKTRHHFFSERVKKIIFSFMLIINRFNKQNKKIFPKPLIYLIFNLFL
jgi:hypothetical protein